MGLMTVATSKDLNLAVADAKENQKPWEQLGAERRARVLHIFANSLEEKRLFLASLMMWESGKPAEDALADVDEAIDFSRLYALDAIKDEQEEREKTKPGGPWEGWRTQANGVSAVISPWNFPLAIPTGQITSAMAAGNTVVFKPSRESPLIGYEIVKLLHTALENEGLSKGVVQFLPGKGSTVGTQLSEHPDVDEIVFTGSAGVGLDIKQGASSVERPGKAHKHVIAEMGGNNAIVVDNGTDEDVAIKIILASAFGFSAQKCSACNRVIIPKELYENENFLQRLKEAAMALEDVMDDPRKLGTFFGPLINPREFQKMKSFVAAAKESGAKVNAEVYKKTGNTAEIGFTIFRNVKSNDSLAQQEQFFPTLSLIPAESFEKAIDILNDTPFKLTGGLISQNAAHIEYARIHAKVGNFTVNGKITGAMVGQQAFGGSGLSGFSGFGSKAGGMGHVRFHRRWAPVIRLRPFKPFSKIGDVGKINLSGLVESIVSREFYEKEEPRENLKVKLDNLGDISIDGTDYDYEREGWHKSSDDLKIHWRANLTRFLMNVFDNAGEGRERNQPRSDIINVRLKDLPDSVIIEVQDHGPGIPQRILDTLPAQLELEYLRYNPEDKDSRDFEKIHQLEQEIPLNRRSTKEGTEDSKGQGIKAMVLLAAFMGGELEIETSSEGTTIRLIFEKGKKDNELTQAPVEPSGPAPTRWWQSGRNLLSIIFLMISLFISGAAVGQVPENSNGAETPPGVSETIIPWEGRDTEGQLIEIEPDGLGNLIEMEGPGTPSSDGLPNFEIPKTQLDDPWDRPFPSEGNELLPPDRIDEELTKPERDQKGNPNVWEKSLFWRWLNFKNLVAGLIASCITWVLLSRLVLPWFLRGEIRTKIRAIREVELRSGDRAPEIGELKFIFFSPTQVKKLSGSFIVEVVQELHEIWWPRKNRNQYGILEELSRPHVLDRLSEEQLILILPFALEFDVMQRHGYQESHFPASNLSTQILGRLDTESQRLVEALYIASTGAQPVFWSGIFDAQVRAARDRINSEILSKYDYYLNFEIVSGPRMADMYVAGERLKFKVELGQYYPPVDIRSRSLDLMLPSTIEFTEGLLAIRPKLKKWAIGLAGASKLASDKKQMERVAQRLVAPWFEILPYGFRVWESSLLPWFALFHNNKGEDGEFSWNIFFKRLAGHYLLVYGLTALPLLLTHFVFDSSLLHWAPLVSALVFHMAGHFINNYFIPKLVRMIRDISIKAIDGYKRRGVLGAINKIEISIPRGHDQTSYWEGQSTAERIDYLEEMMLKRGAAAIVNRIGTKWATNLKLSTRQEDEKKKISQTTRNFLNDYDPYIRVELEKHLLPKIRGMAVLEGILDFNETYEELWRRGEAGGATTYPLSEVKSKKINRYGVWQMPEGRLKIDAGDLQEKLDAFPTRPQQAPYAVYDGVKKPGINFNSFRDNQGPLARLLDLELDGIHVSFHINLNPFWKNHSLVLVEPNKQHNQALRPVAIHAVDSLIRDLGLDPSYRMGINSSLRWGGDVNHMHLHFFQLPSSFDTTPIEESVKKLILEREGVEVYEVQDYALHALAFKGRGPAFDALVMDHIDQILNYRNPETSAEIEHGVSWGSDGTLYVIRGKANIPYDQVIAPVGMGIDGKLGIPYVNGENNFEQVRSDQDVIDGLAAYRSDEPFGGDQYFSQEALGHGTGSQGGTFSDESKSNGSDLMLLPTWKAAQDHGYTSKYKAAVDYAPDYEFMDVMRPIKFWKEHTRIGPWQVKLAIGIFQALGIIFIWGAMLAPPLAIAYFVPDGILKPFLIDAAIIPIASMFLSSKFLGLHSSQVGLIFRLFHFTHAIQRLKDNFLIGF